MGWAAAAAGIGGLAGGLLGGGEEHIGPGDAVPKFMREPLGDLYWNVFDLQTPEYYGGQLIGDRTPGYENALAASYAYGAPGGAGYNIGSAFGQGGMPGISGVGQGMDYLQGMQQAGPRQFQFDQGTFDQTMSNLMPGVQGSFNAAMRDPTRQFTEQMLPGLELGAAMGGTPWGSDIASNRAIAQRGFNDLAADTYSGLYQNALNQAQQAGYGAGSMNLASGQGLDQNMLQGYGSFAGLGSDFLNRAYGIGQSNIGMGIGAGQQDLGYQQSIIDAERAKWDFNQNAPWIAQQQKMAMLPRFGNAMGTPLPPGFGTGGTSAFAGALQGMQSGLGIYGMGQDAGWWGGGGGGGSQPSWLRNAIGGDDPFNIGWAGF